MARRRKQHQRARGGNVFSIIKNIPALAKAIAKAIAIKTAKKTALPATAGLTGYVAGRRHKRPITIKY